MGGNRAGKFSVFVGEQGEGVGAGVWQRDRDRARRVVGLPGLHLHDLRHVAGTLAAATGAGTKEIMPTPRTRDTGRYASLPARDR